MKKRNDGKSSKPIDKERRQNAKDFWRGFLVTLAVVMPVFIAVHFMTAAPAADNVDGTVLEADDAVTDVPVGAMDSYNLLWVLADSDTNNLLSVAVLRFDVENYRVVVCNLPNNSVMLDSMSPAGMMSIYSQRGALGVRNAVEETMGIGIDGYLAIGTNEMAACVDKLGEISFTLGKDLVVTSAEGLAVYSKEAGTSMFSGNDIAKLIINGNYSGVDLMRLHENLWEAFFTQHGNEKLSDNIASLYTMIVNDVATDINSASIGGLAQAVGTVCRSAGTQVEIVRPLGSFINNGYEFSVGADEVLHAYFGQKDS